MENIFGVKRNSEEAGSKVQTGQIPDYLKKYRTKDTIPDFFRDADSLPSRLAVSDDRVPAAKLVNQSYERQKKIEQKRATENAIQKVANIETMEKKPEETKAEPDEVVQLDVIKLTQTVNEIAERKAKQDADRDIASEDKQEHTDEIMEDVEEAKPELEIEKEMEEQEVKEEDTQMKQVHVETKWLFGASNTFN